MLVSFYLISSLFLLISIKWFFSIFYVNKWINREIHREEEDISGHATFFILIPVLVEVGRIENTVKYFIDTFGKEIDFKLVLITTESEYLYYKQRPNTIDVCRELLEKYKDYVIHCHYPETGGRMSHQLNYCINSLDYLIEDNNLIGVYNADSKPHPLTLRWIALKRKEDPSLNLFQQYGDYTKNVGLKTNSVLFSASLWQNRWAIGFELFKSLRSLNSYKNNIFRPLNYLIGHGLFLSKSIYKRSVGFSEVFYNEDAILGLEMSFTREKITPLPFFDISDTPDSIISLYKQKINWFFGPFQAFDYFKFLNKKYTKVSLKEKIVLLFQSFKLFLHTVYWIFGPIFMFYILLYPIFLNNLYMFMGSCLIFMIYFILPNMLVFYLFNNNNKLNSWNLIPSLLLGGLVCYFLHGLSAISAIVIWFRKIIINTPIIKGKTTMKNI